MDKLDVRITRLEPMRVASALGFGAVPETEAWEKLLSWARSEGFVSEPVGGCPVSESLDPDHVAKIVQGVVGELKRRGMA